MEYITITYQALFSILALFLLTKLMGCRQVSTMSMFDYINSITIGSIAAEMATDLTGDYLKPLTAMVVYGVFSIFLSKLAQKFLPIRRIINGKAIVLYLHGELFRENLKKARMEVDEFLMECRVNGYFDLSQIESVILEPNGKISILPITENKPVTPKDLGITPIQEETFANVIMDGQILHYNLKHLGKDQQWLLQQLAIHNIKEVSDVFLAICDRQGNFHVYEKNNRILDHDILG